MIYNLYNIKDDIRIYFSRSEKPVSEALTDPRRQSLPINAHWMNFWELCFPCDIEYDFILKLENITEESNWLLRHLNITKIKYPKGYTHTGASYYLFLVFFIQVVILRDIKF